MSCVDTDVGVTESGGHAVDDASLKRKCSATHYARLWLELVPALCRLHYISRPCLLW